VFIWAQVLLNLGPSVSPGDKLSVKLEGVLNPPTAGSYKLSVSTSSDSVPTTANFSIISSPGDSGKM
jgi:hypothetical protein